MVVPFVVNEVVVSPGPRHAQAVEWLRHVADLAGVVPVETTQSAELARVLGDLEYKRTPRSFTLTDKPGDFRVGGPQDAPLVVENAHRLCGDEDLAIMIGLNRVLSAHSVLGQGLQGQGPISMGHGPISIGHGPISIGHGPISIGHGPISIGHGDYLPFGVDLEPSGGLAQYANMGAGARQPVEWVGAEPQRRSDDELAPARRPVVVTLDTGIGEHPWFEAGVTRGLSLDGVEVGYTEPSTDPEAKGLVWGDLTGALDTHSGHGTFIAGLIRQLCPDADLLAVRIMASNGIANEYELVRCLLVLAELARRDREGRPDGQQVDVIVLSLGYQHETKADQKYDDIILPILRELGSLGVAVVAAAGNGATNRPAFPAAFAPHPGGAIPATEDGIVPLTSVGSLNPNGTLALFSNSGEWVSAWESGASVVSTMPNTFDGGVMPMVSRRGDDGFVRATIDLDDFSAGFGVWSGTSFAAPIFAGRIAAELLAAGRDGTAPDVHETTRIVTTLAERARPRQ